MEGITDHHGSAMGDDGSLMVVNSRQVRLFVNKQAAVSKSYPQKVPDTRDEFTVP